MKTTPEQAFRFMNGQSAMNLEELYGILSLSPAFFDSQLTATGNNFSGWIECCLHDKNLAMQVSSVRERLVFLSILEQVHMQSYSQASSSQSVPSVTSDPVPFVTLVSPPSVAPILASPVNASPIIPSPAPVPSTPSSLSEQHSSSPVQIPVAIEEFMEFETVFQSLLREIEQEMFAEE